jgi:hypothetical protein
LASVLFDAPPIITMDNVELSETTTTYDWPSFDICMNIDPGRRMGGWVILGMNR